MANTSRTSSELKISIWSLREKILYLISSVHTTYSFLSLVISSTRLHLAKILTKDALQWLDSFQI